MCTFCTLQMENVCTDQLYNVTSHHFLIKEFRFIERGYFHVLSYLKRYLMLFTLYAWCVTYILVAILCDTWESTTISLLCSTIHNTLIVWWFFFLFETQSNTIRNIFGIFICYLKYVYLKVTYLYVATTTPAIRCT